MIVKLILDCNSAHLTVLYYFLTSRSFDIKMEDAELAAIRAARLQQLRQNAGSSSPSSLPTPQGIPGGSSNNEADSAKREAEEQMRRDLLATVLDQKARERRKLAILYACVLSNTD